MSYMDRLITQQQKEAEVFLELEECFYHSIQSPLERAEIKFCMENEWCEIFSNCCVTIGKPLGAEIWLGRVEEIDRRMIVVKDAARLTRRKPMMGNALRQDSNYVKIDV